MPLPSYPLTMQIELTPEQNSFIALGIEQGRFRDTEEAVRQAMDLWEKRERARTALVDSLMQAEQELQAGLGETYTADTLDDLAQSIQQRGRERLQASR